MFPCKCDRCTVLRIALLHGSFFIFIVIWTVCCCCCSFWVVEYQDFVAVIRFSCNKTLQLTAYLWHIHTHTQQRILEGLARENAAVESAQSRISQQQKKKRIIEKVNVTRKKRRSVLKTTYLILSITFALTLPFFLPFILFIYARLSLYQHKNFIAIIVIVIVPGFVYVFAL